MGTAHVQHCSSGQYFSFPLFGVLKNNQMFFFLKVRQYTVRTDIPVAVKSVHYEPTVHYSSHLRAVPYSVPALTERHVLQPLIHQTILKR